MRRHALKAGMWRAARQLGVEDHLRRLRYATLPEVARRDVRDSAAMRLLVSWLMAPDDDGIDVGAHRGAIVRRMVEVAPLGRHIAVEPLPQLASELRSTLPTVEVVEAAATDRNGTRPFHHVVDHPGLSGLHPRGAAATERIEVTSVRLDDLASDRRRLKLLKIDVEGAELEVLRGARELVREFRPWIVFEHGLGAADFYGTHADDLFEFFAHSRLRIFGLDGEGPMTASGFRHAFETQTRVNFLARP